MEPSSAEDGDGKGAGVEAPAGPQLQWSRPQLRTETLEDNPLKRGLSVAASMEPSSAEDGDTAIREAGRCHPQCFNGAVLS